MSTGSYSTSAATQPSPAEQPVGSVCFLPVERIRTTYAQLRPGSPQRLPDDTAELPIRVVPTDDGSYELIDGFKRLRRRREQGHSRIPAVVEAPGPPEEHKRLLLLLANSPPRTLTALD